MKNLMLYSIILVFITSCQTPEVPDLVKGKPFEQVYVALSGRYNMIYENTDTVTDANAIWYNFTVKRADRMKDVRQIRRIINRKFYPSPNYVWDKEDLRIVIIFDDQVISAGHGTETMVDFAVKRDSNNQ